MIRPQDNEKRGNTIMDDKRIEVKKLYEEERAGQGEVRARDVWRDKNAKRHNVNNANRKPFFVFACLLAGILLLGVIYSVLDTGNGPHDKRDMSGAANISKQYIGVLYIEGEISEDSQTYDHEYALNVIDGMMENDHNRGLMLYINSPGGGVYESDELYLKIKEYQEDTGRPVYAYLASEAASGGYYVAAPADRISANRNCWTGSIGVRLTTLYDISGLLDKYGIKAENIASGKNKAMGSATEPVTAEQKKIFQSLVDEAYDQFVSVVADGRDMYKKRVIELADGRIYTAKQAKENGLIDYVLNTYDDAISDMMAEYSLYDCEVYEFRYEPEGGLFNSLIESVGGLAEKASKGGDISALRQMMRENSDVRLYYMCDTVR